MGKPEKVPYLHYRGCDCNKCWAAAAKNDTCDDYENWLPGIAEIERTMDCLGYYGLGTKLTAKEIEKIATAISNRLRGKGE